MLLTACLWSCQVGFKGGKICFNAKTRVKGAKQGNSGAGTKVNKSNRLERGWQLIKALKFESVTDV